MKIATWNVNSIRTRLTHVQDWLQEAAVDVLCLQETKVMDDSFPIAAFTEIGYHPHIFGQKSYNGVAIVSRSPLDNVQLGFAAVLGESVAELDEQKRVIGGTIDGIRIVNLYVPNGSSVGSDKYTYKLRWLEVLRSYLSALLEQPEPLLVCGDFNVAPDDIDIHDPTGREKMVMATDLERQALQQAIADLGLSDAFRKFTPEAGHFSWWDYRAAAFRRNLGWRIDHIYLTPDLYDRAINCTIDPAPRKRDQPSDHTPVIVEL
ncbi:exodeoxyribonuclease III [Leptolyngbya sp. FACHB-36]|uniref:exodeoxyribonuclease III n=1 Tax=Leptolyngbya sp. FACHB-36 TaxID=2692808 RepID=UPI001680B710|nr:exodeoxyribonuclease III [Leptolyngbya sp. FACHB-36]MBD2019017.1 exodeoxyribonuclease III [Leptolyngbya sp. FACHB-36]